MGRVVPDDLHKEGKQARRVLVCPCDEGNAGDDGEDDGSDDDNDDDDDDNDNDNN